MKYSDQLESKIKTYLSSLNPKVVEALVRSLENNPSQESSDPHINLVLSTAVNLLREPRSVAIDVVNGIHRRNQVQRLFFAPLERFLINEYLPNHQEGRVNRAVLDRVWNWLGRDVLPDDVRTVLDQAANSEVSAERVDTLVQALRTRSVEAIDDTLHRSEISEKLRRQIGVELGGERGIAELRDIQKILAAEPWLLPFLDSLPDRISEHRLKQDTDVLRSVDKCSARHPDHMAVIAAALIERADAPSALCTFAGRLAGNDDPKVIAASQFAPFVDVVLSEAERLQVLALEHRNNNPDPVAFSQALGEFHELVRGIERDIDLTITGNWRRKLADTKRSISSAVTSELNNAHGAVRRALQVPKVGKNGGLEIDHAAIDEAVRTVRVVVTVRNASESLAVNEVSKRTRHAVEQTLEIVTRSLITDLGKASGKQLEAQIAAADVAIMLSEIYFGGDYAAQLRRSRQSAVAKAQNQEAGAVSNPERDLVAGALGRK